MNQDENWEPFYFESDLCHGWVRYPEDWEDIKLYHPLSKLKRAKSWDRKGRFHKPFFGFVLQCRKGKKTLEEFFIKNNMDFGEDTYEGY